MTLLLLQLWHRIHAFFLPDSYLYHPRHYFTTSPYLTVSPRAEHEGPTSGPYLYVIPSLFVLLCTIPFVSQTFPFVLHFSYNTSIVSVRPLFG